MERYGMATTKIAAKFSSWKEALHQTCIRSLKVAPKRVADHLGISVSTLSHACDENLPDNLSSKHLPALVQIPDIDLSCLDYLEALAGRLAFVVPTETGEACTTRMTAQAMRAMASLLDAKAEAVEDGRICSDEARDIRESADQVTKCVQAIAAYAERVAQPERPSLKQAVNS